MLPQVQRGNGKPGDLRLLRAVESYICYAPKSVRSAFPKVELVNAVWLIFKRRGVRKPSRLQVKCAAIDYMRSTTHYRKGKNYPDVLPQSTVDRQEMRDVLNKRTAESNGEKRALLVDFVRNLRSRTGYRGVCQFLLTDVIGLDPELTGQALEE
jgi:hypothetical protein